MKSKIHKLPNRKHHDTVGLKKIIINTGIYLTVGISMPWNNRVIAQDIHFSQFLMTPLLYNPSFAGKFGGDYRGIINYREQWKSITKNAYKTYGGCFDIAVHPKNGSKNYLGLGLSVYVDQAGASQMKNTLANLTMAYHLQINPKSYVSAGIQGGINQRSFTTSGLQFDSQFDGSQHNPSLSSNETFNGQSIIKLTASAGISYSWADDKSDRVISNNNTAGNKYSVGFAAYQVNSPAYSFVKSEHLALRYVGSFNTSFGLANKNIAIQPGGFVMFQNKATNIVAGTMIRYTLKEQSKYTHKVKGAALSLGAYYRFADAFIAKCLIETGPIAIGISYDVNTSLLTAASRGKGGFEISIRYISPNPFTSRKSQARFY